MSSSSSDELPDIPGTRFPWMELSSSSRSPRKPTKRPRVSAVEKERNTYKDPKKKPIRMDISSDDDFEDPQPGPSKAKPTTKKRPMTNAEKCAKQRAKKTIEQKEATKKADAARKAAAGANETQEEHLQRNTANAERMAASRARETQEEHLQRNMTKTIRNDEPHSSSIKA